MHLSDHSLSQLDAAYVQTLDEGALRGLLLRALEDLKEARERLGQNPTNSSRPPSSQAPWDRPSAGQDATHGDAADDAASTPDQEGDQPDEASTPPQEPSTQSGQTSKPKTPKRKPGKQPGAPGFGRTQVFEAQETRAHRPEVCEGCGKTLPADAPSVAYAGFQSIDLVWGDVERPGLHLHITDHRLHDGLCECGHHTRARPAKAWSRTRAWARLP